MCVPRIAPRHPGGWVAFASSIYPRPFRTRFWSFLMECPETLGWMELPLPLFWPNLPPHLGPLLICPKKLVFWIASTSTFTLVNTFCSQLLCVFLGLAHNTWPHWLPCSFCPYSDPFWAWFWPLPLLLMLAFSVAPRHVVGWTPRYSLLFSFCSSPHIKKMTGEAPEIRSDKRKPGWTSFEHRSTSISINQHQSASISIIQH